MFQTAQYAFLFIFRVGESNKWSTAGLQAGLEYEFVLRNEQPLEGCIELPQVALTQTLHAFPLHYTEENFNCTVW